MIKFNISSKNNMTTKASSCSIRPHSLANRSNQDHPVTFSWFGNGEEDSSSDEESEAGSSVSVNNDTKTTLVIPQLIKSKSVCSKKKPKKLLKNTSEKKKFLEKIAEIKDNGYYTKDLKNFVKKQSDIKTTFTKDGEIIISGVGFEIPDLAKKYQEDYLNQLKLIKELNCEERVMVSRWMKIVTLVAIFLAVALTVIGLIYLIYKTFFFANDQ